MSQNKQNSEPILNQLVSGLSYGATWIGLALASLFTGGYLIDHSTLSPCVEGITFCAATAPLLVTAIAIVGNDGPFLPNTNK